VRTLTRNSISVREAMSVLSADNKVNS